MVPWSGRLGEPVPKPGTQPFRLAEGRSRLGGGPASKRPEAQSLVEKSRSSRLLTVEVIGSDLASPHLGSLANLAFSLVDQQGRLQQAPGTQMPRMSRDGETPNCLYQPPTSTGQSYRCIGERGISMSKQLGHGRRMGSEAEVRLDRGMPTPPNRRTEESPSSTLPGSPCTCSALRAPANSKLWKLLSGLPFGSSSDAERLRGCKQENRSSKLCTFRQLPGKHHVLRHDTLGITWAIC